MGTTVWTQTTTKVESVKSDLVLIVIDCYEDYANVKGWKFLWWMTWATTGGQLQHLCGNQREVSPDSPVYLNISRYGHVVWAIYSVRKQSVKHQKHLQMVKWLAFIHKKLTNMHNCSPVTQTYFQWKSFPNSKHRWLVCSSHKIEFEFKQLIFL